LSDHTDARRTQVASKYADEFVKRNGSTVIAIESSK
jgi:hypothetical protein